MTRWIRLVRMPFLAVLMLAASSLSASGLGVPTVQARELNQWYGWGNSGGNSGNSGNWYEPWGGFWPSLGNSASSAIYDPWHSTPSVLDTATGVIWPTIQFAGNQYRQTWQGSMSTIPGFQQYQQSQYQQQYQQYQQDYQRYQQQLQQYQQPGTNAPPQNAPTVTTPPSSRCTWWC
jgi:hypothetical protein